MEKSISFMNKVLKKVTDLTLSNIKKDKYNTSYEGFDFRLGDLVGKIRTARKTKTKDGYFVAFWEKDLNGKNIAYKEDDPFDLLVIYINDDSKEGVLVLNKEDLLSLKILSSSIEKGKMGFRVYTSLDSNLNKSAKLSASFYKDVFIDASNLDLVLIKKLFKI